MIASIKQMRIKNACIATVTAVALAALASCSTSPSASSASDDRIRIVAAENVWGSIAAQLGGDHVQVTSIIDNLAADPHDFEPTSVHARAVATADLVIVNGAGYDAWATKLVDANPSDSRVLLDVGALVGVEGHAHGDEHAPEGNPHLWYDPHTVQDVVAQLTSDLSAVAPEHATDFEAAGATFTTTALAPYRAAVADIERDFAGTKVGASESFFALLAPEVGLDLITPERFVNAVSEGIDPRTDDKAVADAQIAEREIAVYVANTQSSTPDVRAQVAAADGAGIPVVSMTETINPSDATFQGWQTAQLRALHAALAKSGA